ncbi:pyridoxal phosphate-dependent aminotransferase [Intestinimonas sp.]|uniref:pyridoxal phosphate-dependent aminotransferase n=1 Tax=Intestinimonas sp. TaxID=1965293 RepID=UPI00262C2277|nr:pyridoxal phosphate-dependent aminotransferase [Intestinimonas sp.]
MSHLPENMVQLGSRRNIMREIREYGLLRAREVGVENVLDFSLGNPSVPPPPQVNDTIRAILDSPQGDSIHAYTSAQGDLAVRESLAASLTRRFGMHYGPDDLYITVGAAAGLCCCFRALACPGDEFILMAPYFTEYDIFVRGNGGIPVVVPPDYTTFQPDMKALEAAITPKTKALVVNSPNNPSGAIYSAETLSAMADLLRRKAAEYGHPIYLISDEPYREIVFQGFTVPWIPDFYDDTLVCYSYSKSLSAPGERIGYVLVGEKVAESRAVYAAICGAGRVLGYVNAPSLFQRVAAACDGLTADLTVYQTNRDLLYRGLTAMGYTCVEPGGTFYLLLKSPVPDAGAFCKRAQDYDLLFPPTDDFACPGWCRIAFCTATEQVEKALPIFEKLAREYGLSL